MATRDPWARLGDMKPEHMVRIIARPTDEPCTLVGVLSPGGGRIGYALTPGEAYQLGQLLIDCANEIGTAEKR